jgi:GNAT superfamily N-acetyltransferase
MSPRNSVLGAQFPVLREQTTYPAQPGSVTTPLRTVRFTAVDRENDRPASFASYDPGRWRISSAALPSGPQLPGGGSSVGLDWTRGEDVPMFEHVPASIGSIGTHSDYRGRGLALGLINHITDEMWRTGEVPVGQVPEVSTQLSPDSAGMYQTVTGRSTPEDAHFWTEDRRRMDGYSDDLLDPADDVRGSTLRDVEALGPVRRPNYTAEVAPEPSSTIEQKLEQVRDEAGPPIPLPGR